MNPTAQSETQSTSKWGRLAWLPILLLLAAIVVARVAGLSESWSLAGTVGDFVSHGDANTPLNRA